MEQMNEESVHGVDKPRGRALRSSRTMWGPPRLVVGLVLLTLVARYAASLTGYFWNDDFLYNEWARSESYGWNYLTPAFSDHMGFFGLSMNWLTVRIFGDSYELSMLWLSGMYALGVLLLYLLLKELFGWRQQFYLVLILAAFTPITFGPSLWVSAATLLVPYFAFSYLTFLTAWRYLKSPSPLRFALLAVATLLLASSYEFSAFTSMLIIVFVLAVPVSHRSDEHAEISRYRWEVVATQVILILVVFFYYIGRTSSVGDPASAGSAITSVVQGLLVATIPAVFGGPWTYNGYMSAEWPTLSVVSILALLVLLVFVVAIVRRAMPRAAVIWGITIAICAAMWVAVSAGRTTDGSAPIVLRYAAPAIVALSLALAYSMTSTRRGSDMHDSVAGTGVLLWRSLNSHMKSGVVAVISLGLSLSLAIGLQQPIFSNPYAPGRSYVENAKAGFEQIPAGTNVLSQQVPMSISNPFTLAPGIASTEIVLGGLANAPEFSDTVYNALFGFGNDGSVHPQGVDGPGPSGPKPDELCGWSVSDQPVAIELENEVAAGDHTAQLNTLSSTEVTVEVALSGAPESVKVVLPAGLHTTFFWLPSSVTSNEISIRTIEPSKVCLDSLRVGTSAHFSNGEVIQDLPATSKFDVAEIR